MSSHTIRLTEGFSIRDVTGDGAHFSVMPSNMTEAELEPAHEAFDGNARLSYYRADIIDAGSDKYNTPFERHRSIMENVTSDGAVKKKIVRTGADIVVPPNAFVKFHYNAYMEYSDEPFDSSVLQGKPHRAKLNSGEGGLLPGLELGLLTMRRGEKADILVQPDLAYGAMGCPPRIPPKAEILFDVELLDWTVSPDSELIEAIDEAHLSGSVWEKAKSDANRLRANGNECYKYKNYKKALREYRSAEKIVGTCRLQNETEEEEHNNLLRKLHTNIAICHYELKQYNDVCIHCKEALAFAPNDPKTNYYWGLALTAMNEFSSAKDRLLKAKKGLPNDKNINDALNRLEEKVRATSEEEKLFWRKAINPKGKTDKEKNKNNHVPSSPWNEQLVAFRDNPNEKRILLPGGMDDDELDAVCADVQALGLEINTGSDTVCVFKKE